MPQHIPADRFHSLGGRVAVNTFPAVNVEDAEETETMPTSREVLTYVLENVDPELIATLRNIRMLQYACINMRRLFIH